jgi:transcriptional activator SPT7
MSLHNHLHQQWLPPGHLRPPDDHHDSFPMNLHLRSISRPRTPQIGIRAATLNAQMGSNAESDIAPEEDPRMAFLKERYNKTESRVSALFGIDGEIRKRPTVVEDGDAPRPEISGVRRPSAAPTPTKKPARKLDDDDYDMDDDEDEDDNADTNPSPLKSKSTGVHVAVPSISSPARTSLPTAPSSDSSKDKTKTAEDVRKQHEEDKKAAEDAARRSFHTIFYTLEDDRNAMLDQQRLEEVERQADAETSGHGPNNNANNAGNGRGTLASANLGASSLTLKNLIARIDRKRDQVQASDAELRSLMSEVRKNRSKWANEEKVGQEELYESAEKVLSELKAMTEHSTAFLTKVNRREAPDYYTSEYERTE